MSIISRDLTLIMGSTALSLSLATILVVSPVGSAAAEPDPYAAPITIPANGALELPDGQEIEYSGGSKVRVITVSSGATLTGTNAIIKSNGIGPDTGGLASVIWADAGSTVELTGGSVSTTGNIFTRGILGTKAGTTITTNDTNISTTGHNSHAVHVTNGATATVNGGIISTEGNDSFGLYSQNGSRITAENIEVSTTGVNGFGVFTYGNGSFLELSDSSITTTNTKGHGVVAGQGTTIEVSDTVISTNGESAWGIVADQTNTSVTAENVDITTNGNWAYGAYANGLGTNTVSIELQDGTIETHGERAFGLLSARGATISSSAEIITHGDKAHGVQAGANGSTADGTDGSVINLVSGAGVATEGADAFGLHAIDGGEIRGTVNIETKGVNGFGAFAESYSTIDLHDGRIVTEGASAHGLIANNDRLTADSGAAGGAIRATNMVVETSGAGAAGAWAEDGGEIEISGSIIEARGENANALKIVNSGTITVEDTILSSADAATVGVSLTKAGEEANVTFGSGTIALQNNGKLLQVDRSGDGGDGIVNFTLAAGSQSQGDIVDQGDKTAGGGTDVTLEDGASWTGRLFGIRDFLGAHGGSVEFVDEADIAGDLTGNGTGYSFSDMGGTIGGNVNLSAGSFTTGGSIADRIHVGGNVMVDQTSRLGGNWQIDGNFTNAGILSPGNSAGIVGVGGNLVLEATSAYHVDLYADGTSDFVDVTGKATLDGKVLVTPLDGFQINSPYMILTAGEMEGQFGSVEFSHPSAFLFANLHYGDTDVAVAIERNDVSFASVAQTANQAAGAAVLDMLPLSSAINGPVVLLAIDDAPDAPPPSSEVALSIAMLAAEEAAEAFMQLSGETHASFKPGLIETANLAADAINNRLRTAFEGVAAKDAPVLSYARAASASGSQAFDAIAPVTYDYGVWATGFGSWIDYDGGVSAMGVKSSMGGFVSGVDMGLASGWRLGVVGGYSQTDLHARDRRSSAKSDNWHLGVYGGNQWGPVGLRAGLSNTWHSIDSSRSVAYPGFSDQLDADYDARTFQAFGELSYRIDTAVRRQR